ncbi:MAG: hypothetical protein Q7U57_14460 [Methylovulum sp.]|nr:hypothetical protein [Methylovulum sp.]
MTVRTSAGSTLKISASAPATFNAAGYSALVYTSVGEITDLGEFGREFTLVTHNAVGSRGTQKFKGSFNEGTMNLSLGLDTDDAGQVLMKAGSLSDTAYSFEVTTQNGDSYYFQAMVMSFKVGVGSVDSITTATCTLEITTSAGGIGVVEDLAA